MILTRARVALFAAALGVLGASRLEAASTSPARGPRGMAVTPEALATQVAFDVLRRGGNAVDASVAAAFTLAVTNPRAGSLGGGGFLLYREPGGKFRALDFREAAPAALRPEAFRDGSGKADPSKSVEGGLSIGVPGLVAGLEEAHRRWGTRPWEELIAPAIGHAERGFTISRLTASTLSGEAGRLARQPAARALFTHEGKPLLEGERLVQKDLAKTLAVIAASGARGFYEGKVADSIVASSRALGGVMRLTDLEAYRAVYREPIVGRYRGYRIVSFPPPSSGGVILLQILGMLEPLDLRASGAGSSTTVHRMVEAERRAFADRSRWLGDPAFFSNPIRGLLEPAYLASRWKSFREHRATPSSRVAPGIPLGAEPTETLHLSIADAYGGAVALTETINSWYGCACVAEGTGVLLNNEIDDFATAPGVPNQFGLVGGKANAVEPRKRPLSTMSPTIVDQGDPSKRPTLVLGSPGGPTIVTTVLQVISNVIDHGMRLEDAVARPRFHHQWQPDQIDHEPDAFPADVAAGLTRRGHLLHPREAIGIVAAIGLDEDGAWVGVADPRGEGTASGY